MMLDGWVSGASGCRRLGILGRMEQNSVTFIKLLRMVQHLKLMNSIIWNFPFNIFVPSLVVV